MLAAALTCQQPGLQRNWRHANKWQKERALRHWRRPPRHLPLKEDRVSLDTTGPRREGGEGGRKEGCTADLRGRTIVFSVDADQSISSDPIGSAPSGPGVLAARREQTSPQKMFRAGARGSWELIFGVHDD